MELDEPTALETAETPASPSRGHDAGPAGGAPWTAAWAAVQSGAGNGAAQLLVRRHLSVGAVDDPAEREADAVAAAAAARLAALRRGDDAEDADQADGGWRPAAGAAPLLRSASPGAGPDGGPVDDGDARAIAEARASGAPLPAPLRRSFETAMGARLGPVRVHTDARADRLNRRLNAEAFTTGSDVFFRRGAYAPGSERGDRLLAHELTHVVQDGGAARRAPLRRKLHPDLDRAFHRAVALRDDYSRWMKETDDRTTAREQKDLLKLEGRFKRGAKGDEQETLADLVRVVRTTQFVERLVALDQPQDRNGKERLLTDAEKAAKRKVYAKKSDEWRQKHAPLVRKGPAAPETQAFLKEYGLDKAFAPSPHQRVRAGVGTARIEVRSTFIGGPILGIRLRAHLFIVYTSRQGKQLYFRGGPDGDEAALLTVADMGEYTPATIDWDPSAPSVTLLEGEAAEAKLDRLIEATRVIDGMKVPYVSTIGRRFGGDNPNLAQRALSTGSEMTSSEGENCNATAWTILTRAGVKPKKPSGRHPGWGSILGSKTEGKQDALPAAEEDGDGEPYRLDKARDLVEPRSGLIQAYRDRGLFDPAFKVAPGAQVLLLAEFEDCRKVRLGSAVGYIGRSEVDAGLHLRKVLRDLVAANFTDAEVDEIATFDVDDVDEKLSLEIFAARINMEASALYDLASELVEIRDEPAEVMVNYLTAQLDGLTDAEMLTVLDDPYEVRSLAERADVAPDVAQEAIQNTLATLGQRERVRAELRKHRDRPDAANLAFNEHPDYPTAKMVAVALRYSLREVLDILEGLRPDGYQPLTSLIAEYSGLLVDPKDPDEESLKQLHEKTGLPEPFLRQRLIAIREDMDEQERQAQAKRDAAAREAGPPSRDPIRRMLGERIDGPGALPFLLQDLPDYPALAEIADELGLELDEVVSEVFELLPADLAALGLLADYFDEELDDEELELLATSTEEAWQTYAADLGSCYGVNAAFVQKRAARWRAANAVELEDDEPHDVAEVQPPGRGGDEGGGAPGTIELQLYEDIGGDGDFTPDPAVTFRGSADDLLEASTLEGYLEVAVLGGHDTSIVGQTFYVKLADWTAMRGAGAQ